MPKNFLITENEKMIHDLLEWRGYVTRNGKRYSLVSGGSDLGGHVDP